MKGRLFRSTAVGRSTVPYWYVFTPGYWFPDPFGNYVRYPAAMSVEGERGGYRRFPARHLAVQFAERKGITLV